MPRSKQRKKSNKDPSSGGAKAKRRKTADKGDTNSRTDRPSRTLSPTLSATERQAKQAVVLMDLEVIRKYFRDNELAPPSTTFKSDWADVYASACAIRRLSGHDPLPPLPQAKAFSTPGAKRKKGVKRKTPSRPKKEVKKGTKAASPSSSTPPQEPGSESTDLTVESLSKLSPAHREKVIEALLNLRDVDRQDHDDGHGLGPNPTERKKKHLFVDESTPQASDASDAYEEEDEGEDLGGSEDSEDQDNSRGGSKKKPVMDEQLATQVRSFFSEMMKSMQVSPKSTDPIPRDESQDPSKAYPREDDKNVQGHPRREEKNALPSSNVPKGTPPPFTPRETPPFPPLLSSFGGGGLEAAWRRVPGSRTDSTATKQWSRIYDAAKRAVTSSAPAPLIAWRKVTHDLEMWNRLSDLDHQSGDGFLLNFNASSSDPFRISRRSRLPPKITSWSTLWEAVDNRAATICIFFPEDAAGTITDRATLKSLQDGGLTYSAAEEWINTAMYKANAPCKPFGPLDNETMVKLLAAKTVSPSPNPKPRGQDTRQTGKRPTPPPHTGPTQGPAAAPPPPGPVRSFQAALRNLVHRTHRSNTNTHSLCRNYNMGTCNLDDQHASPSNSDKKLAHKCCVCLQGHPASACPDAGLPTP